MNNLFTREKHKNHNPRVYWALTVRHFKVFFKNKVSILFSLLVPLITLLIYILFLRRLQINVIDSSINDILPNITKDGVSKSYILADAWMLSGIIAVSCISVSLNTCVLMVTDKTNGVSRDFVSSPISRRSINASYILFNILATFFINFIILLISYIYLGAIGGFHISPSYAILLIPTLFISVFSASLVTCFIISFISNWNIYNSASVIVSSTSGFLIGAYMPASMLPEGANRLTLFFPGTYSAGLLRTLFLSGYIDDYKFYLREVEKISEADIDRALSKLQETISFDIDFFGTKLEAGYMVLALLIFAVLFMILNIMFLDHNLVGSLHGRHKFKRIKKSID